MLQAGLDIRVASLLIDLEGQLRQLNLWQQCLPSSEELASVEPFCVDTLTFPQWLQFVFLPRIRELIEQQQSLPNNCAIGPMAQTYFSGLNVASMDLVAVIEQLDEVLTR